MPEENPLTRTLREIVEKREQETRIHREHLNCLKDSFRKNQGDLTDAELLEIILDASSRIDKLEFDQEDDLDPYMSSLTFTTTSLVEADGESLKTAWSKFLGKTFLGMKDRDGDRYDIIALWYFTKEMWPHSVAVYEHLYHQVRSSELVNDQEWHAWWVLQLWKSCDKRGLKQRARELFGRISEYHDDDEISIADYFEVLIKDGELRYLEMGDTIDRDRSLTKERLRLERSQLFDDLHQSTKSLLVDAELWSSDRLRRLEPTAGPRRWALAIEAEFHHKVYEPNKNDLDRLLEDDRPKRGHTCGLGKISLLIKRSGSNAMKKAVVDTVSGWRSFASIPNLVKTLELISDHRNQIAHVTELGPYTLERCNAFMKAIRGSDEWIFSLLSAIQPTREDR